jgi:hypothetical protein
VFRRLLDDIHSIAESLVAILALLEHYKPFLKDARRPPPPSWKAK